MTVLNVLLNGEEIAVIKASDLPCEVTPSRPIRPDALLEFVDGAGTRHAHSLGDLSGWLHLSVRVHKSLVCQSDCIVSNSENLDPTALGSGSAAGIRFQPFFLPGSSGDPNALLGQGLFRRGLHFSGTVTPGSVRLSCECDHCRRTFQIQSFHAGFSNVGYMYSGSGANTLIIDDSVPGAPPALGKPDMKKLAALEAILPPAPDGSRFSYLNPFRCPHCARPYIDFEAHPNLREQEYYGNTIFSVSPIHYEPSATPPARRGLFSRLFGA